jgi:spore germination cell wall hydrolase CwlJ-like protein
MRLLTVLASILFAIFLSFFAFAFSQVHVPTKMNVKFVDLSRDARKEVECLAQNIYFESAHEPTEGKIAVAFVTLNRMKSGHFPDTYCEVVKQKTHFEKYVVCQFSWYCEDKPLAILKSKSLTVNNNSLYNDILDLSLNFYLNNEKMKDPTKGALFYHADYVSPGWANMKRTAYIGRHIFYQKTNLRKV